MQNRYELLIGVFISSMIVNSLFKNDIYNKEDKEKVCGLIQKYQVKTGIKLDFIKGIGFSKKHEKMNGKWG